MPTSFELSSWTFKRYHITAIVEMITNTEVYKSTCGDAKGWAFSVTWDNRPYPNFVSALYKTRKEAHDQLQRYLAGNGFDYYGSAE